MTVSLPERFEEFANARRNGFLKVMELKKSGQTICGTFCQYTPTEILRAAGLYEVSLCGKSAEPIPAAEKRLPANLCPLIKASYGHVLEETCPYGYFSDLVVGETTCDGKKKMYELLGELKPMQVIHLPNIPDPARSMEMWVTELRAFTSGLEEKLGVEITDDKLNEAIVWCNKERRQAARIYELGKYDPPAITGTHMRDIMEGERYVFNRKEKYAHLNEILNQCEADWHAGNGPFSPDPNRPRILISGAGLGGVADKTVKILEEKGGAVVCYEGCSGIVSRRRLIDEDTTRDPIVRIAEKYIEVPCAVVSPNHRRMEQVAATIEEWKVDGVVSVTLHSCNPFAVETENIRRVCRRCGVPLLHISTDFGDGDIAQITTRIEAFLEMIRADKEARNG